MGYTKEQLVPHSFKNTFSTICNEHKEGKTAHGYSYDVLEALLAHKENAVRGAYNHSTYTQSMRGLIEWYADYLDRLKVL